MLNKTLVIEANRYIKFVFFQQRVMRHGSDESGNDTNPGAYMGVHAVVSKSLSKYCPEYNTILEFSVWNMVSSVSKI